MSDEIGRGERPEGRFIVTGYAEVDTYERAAELAGRLGELGMSTQISAPRVDATQGDEYWTEVVITPEVRSHSGVLVGDLIRKGARLLKGEDGEPDTAMVSHTKTLERANVRTLRDLIAIGSLGIGDIRNFGPKGVVRLERALRELRIEWQQHPADVQAIARLYDNFDDVPCRILLEGVNVLEDVQRMTVQQIINLSQEDRKVLFRTYVAPSKGNAGGYEYDQPKAEHIQALAIGFRERYLSAREELTGQID